MAHSQSGMHQSYITHQRRAALIPDDADLSPEDEQAVRLRTGNLSPHGLNRYSPRKPDNLAMTEARGDAMGFEMQDQPKRKAFQSKRKASTTSEEYRGAFITRHYTRDDNDLSGYIDEAQQDLFKSSNTADQRSQSDPFAGQSRKDERAKFRFRPYSVQLEGSNSESIDPKQA